MCLRVQEYVLSDEAPMHTLDDVQEPFVGTNVTGGQEYNNVAVTCWQRNVIHKMCLCALCLLAVDINVTGGQE